MRSMLDALKKFFLPGRNADLDAAFAYRNAHLPTLWLLGKTGAGKSSLIQALTGDDAVAIGNGFAPCTRTSCAYDFPAQRPVLRFLDTRGLAEADYDPDADIQTCLRQGHALVLVIKADDPEQSALLRALAQIKRQIPAERVLIVHSAVKQLPSAEQQPMLRHNQQQLEAVWHREIPFVAVDFELDEGGAFGIDALIEQLARLLPIVAQVARRKAQSGTEPDNFAALQTEVLWYAGAAGAADAVPAVGLVAVPGIQAKLLHSLASQYGVDWNGAAFSEFLGALGAGFAVKYASRLGIRELVKLVPVYGQVVGGATAAVISFASTYAIGRAACKFLYHKRQGQPVSHAELQAMYREALTSIKEVAESEAPKA